MTPVLDEVAEVRSEAAPRVWRRMGWLALATVLVLALGAVEGWFGRTDSGDVYGSDGVQYLDVARAFERGDLKSALNPLWSQGYPAVLAVSRPLFRAGPAGDWAATRWVNLGIFAFTWVCFAWFVRELLNGRRWTAAVWLGAAGVFVAAQVCIDQVSRVGPDQFLAGFFFLACGLVLKISRWSKPASRKREMEQPILWSVGLGAALGLGFLVKAVFLPLGCVLLAVLAVALWSRRGRVREVLAAALVFGVIVLSYGSALSRAVGRPTLGESGSINYAWHVDRLAKWVHWEGGNESAAKAWPKPWIARFAQWESNPPDFGTPLHPSVRIGTAPMIYEFHAPVRATYVPYYDPPYWYQGYRHVVRWRYQLVALGKSLGDLAQVLVRQPLVWLFGLALVWMASRKDGRARLLPAIREAWPVVAIAGVGIMIYLPVHLEGRYLSGFLAVIAMVVLMAIFTDDPTHDVRQGRHEWGADALIAALLLAGCVAGLVKDQRGIWLRAAHRWSPNENVEWRAAEGVRALGLPAGSEVGVIAWTANLHCDWAYMSQLQITSEIASPEDESDFWRLPPDGRAKVLGEFRRAGATAVFSWDKPRTDAEGWVQVSGAPMWVYRL